MENFIIIIMGFLFLLICVLEIIKLLREKPIEPFKIPEPPKRSKDDYFTKQADAFMQHQKKINEDINNVVNKHNKNTDGKLPERAFENKQEYREDRFKKDSNDDYFNSVGIFPVVGE